MFFKDGETGVPARLRIARSPCRARTPGAPSF